MDDLIQHIAEFATTLTEAEGFDDTADQLVAYAIEVAEADFGAITLLRPRGRLETLHPTDETAAQADHAQYRLSEGPCVDAATRERAALSGSVAADPRWPRWGPAVAELGVSSVLSAGMHSRGVRIGALNLYSTRPRAFSREDLELATILADQAATVLAGMRTEHGLREALESRTMIGQAQGVLMERFDLDPDQAFSVLKRYSQEHNVKLRDIAERLLALRDVGSLDVDWAQPPPVAEPRTQRIVDGSGVD